MANLGVGWERSVVGEGGGVDKKYLFNKRWNLIWEYTFLSLPKTTPVFKRDEAARIIKKQVCKRLFFDSSMEIPGLFCSLFPQQIIAPPPPPNWSCSCCYQCIHYRLVSDKSTEGLVSHKLIKIQEKSTKKGLCTKKWVVDRLYKRRNGVYSMEESTPANFPWDS